MQVGEPHQPGEKDYGKDTQKEKSRIIYGEVQDGPTAGNNEKDAVDVHNELAAKGLITKVEFEKVTEVAGDTSVNGMVVVTLAIAALAYALYAA